MSSDTWKNSFGAVCLSWLLRFPWFPGSLRCVAQNPRILLMVNLIQRIHYSYACAFYFSLPLHFSHRDPMYCTLSFNCVPLQTLPTEQAAHACKARPLTTVGRTSLSDNDVINFASWSKKHSSQSSGTSADRGRGGLRELVLWDTRETLEQGRWPCSSVVDRTESIFPTLV